MTIQYNTKVSDTGIMTFVRLFFRYLMTDDQKRLFEKICCFFYKYSDFIPLTFMLGFFVTLVVNRWWEMWRNIGWIDTAGLYIVTYIPGNDDKSRIYRRNIVRYLLFFQVLVLRDISTAIRNRFPTLDTMVPSGYLTEEELEDYLNTPTTYKNYYTPIRWAMNMVRQARSEFRVSSDHAVQDLLKRILEFRATVGTLLTYDFQPIPLLYTVVVCLTVRIYFLIALLGHQILEQAPNPGYVEVIDLYFPIMTILQFVFYMGWMKVAEALLNPFGEDDDDFEVNWLIDRNFEVGFVIADQNHDRPLVKDKHWNNKYPEPLYSISTMNASVNPLVGSAVRAEESRRGSTQFRRDSILPNGDVIMVPRAPANVNEDAMADETTVHVRSRIQSVDVGGTGLINGVRRKLSRLTGTVSPQDTEIGEKDDYTFTRKSTRRRHDESTRRRVASTIREEDDREREVGDPVGGFHQQLTYMSPEAKAVVDGRNDRSRSYSDSNASTDTEMKVLNHSRNQP
ncbi:bestrophin, RFP-TM, chloride channel domain-containing protein [Ditylenchus destructor]|uniref:Bestrophin homolog n=1 Tax=Ditylenchus destructor TaxID=166010 RepID=A0AAD4N9M6_9BILA|nr:bestrophin, RFP-TM, chloride channel domain-containing protein [Ditylenchus destructor]